MHVVSCCGLHLPNQPPSPWWCPRCGAHWMQGQQLTQRRQERQPPGAVPLVQPPVRYLTRDTTGAAETYFAAHSGCSSRVLLDTVSGVWCPECGWMHRG